MFSSFNFTASRFYNRNFTFLTQWTFAGLIRFHFHRNNRFKGYAKINFSSSTVNNRTNPYHIAAGSFNKLQNLTNRPSGSDYILYQKGELLDAVYLQQNSFDPIDAACEPERQAHEFNVLYDVLTRDYALSDKKEIRAFFNQVRQEFLDWHGTVYGTPEFAAQETKLTDLYRSKVTG